LLSAFSAAGVLTGCGAAPQVKALPDYRPDTLGGKTVLLLPLAVSDDLGDARTGIILSSETRRTASALACHEIASERQEGQVVCIDRSPAGKLPELAELELVFAADKPIPAQLLTKLRMAASADYLLLFRPESVSSSHEVSHDKTLRSNPGMVLLAGPWVAWMLAEEVKTTSNSMDLKYTISAALIEARSGKLLKMGVHSGGDSRKEDRYMGYAEAPPVTPILAEIMSELGQAVLDD
jgi:hypothetical protein